MWVIMKHQALSVHNELTMPARDIVRAYICDSQSVSKLSHLLFFYTSWKYLSATVGCKVPNTRFLGHKNQVKILTKYLTISEEFWEILDPLPDIHKMSDILQNSQVFRVSLNIVKNSQNWSKFRVWVFPDVVDSLLAFEPEVMNLQEWDWNQ